MTFVAMTFVSSMKALQISGMMIEINEIHVANAYLTQVSMVSSVNLSTTNV